MARISLPKFRAWVIRNKGDWIDKRCQDEWARFRTDDGLCIIYHDWLGNITACVGKECAEAFEAFRAKRDLPLSTPPIKTMQPEDHWRERAKAIPPGETF